MERDQVIELPVQIDDLQDVIESSSCEDKIPGLNLIMAVLHDDSNTVNHGQTHHVQTGHGQSPHGKSWSKV